MPNPLGAVLAAIGIGVTAAGAASASEAARAKARAEIQGSKKQLNLVKKQNKFNEKVAAEQAKASQAAADLQTASGQEANALRDQIVAGINTTRQQMVNAQNLQATASVEAETARFQQMTLDATRQRREVIRNALITRSQALAGTVAAGAQGGSGLQGGLAQIAAQRSSMLTGIFQNTDIGNAIFQANKAFTEAGALVNQFQASLETQRSLGESQLANLQATTQGQLSQLEAASKTKQAQLQIKNIGLQTKREKAQSLTNQQISRANTKAVTAQGIESIGSSLIQAGTALA